MHKRYPPTQSMLTFLQVARAGSFSRAARELNLTHSAISQQIRTLEDHIGTPVFVRSGRGAQLTEAGRQFARLLPDGLEQIDRALSLAQSGDMSPTRLTIEVDVELAQNWLNARLPTIVDALPQHRILFRSRAGGEQPASGNTDLALCYGYGDWQDREYMRICHDRVIAIAAPALLERQGLTAPIAPEQILDLPQLGYTRRTWVPWLDAAGLSPVEPDTIATFDNVANLVAAVDAGLGVGLVRSLLVHDMLRDGRLLELTTTEIPAQYNLYAVWPQGRDKPVASVVETIKRLAKDSL